MSNLGSALNRDIIDLLILLCEICLHSTLTKVFCELKH